MRCNKYKINEYDHVNVDHILEEKYWYDLGLWREIGRKVFLMRAYVFSRMTLRTFEYFHYSIATFEVV